MKNFFLPFVLVLALFISFAPLAYAAESTFFGPIVPPECNCASVISPNSGKEVTSAPDWGCVMQTVQNSINFAISLGMIIAILYIILSGFLFVMSAGNPGLRETAKTRIVNVFIGMLVVLAAWLVVDFVMKRLYGDDGVFGPWNAILSADGKERCLQVAKAPQPLPGAVGQAPPPPVASTSTSATAPSVASTSAPVQETAGKYSTQAEAARAALQQANPISIRDNLEYGGLIYRDSTGQYGFTGPVKGKTATVNVKSATVPSGAQEVGFYHTHGDYTWIDPVTNVATRSSDPAKDSFDSDMFSETDMQLVVSWGNGIQGYEGYLGTPSGKFLYFDAATEVVGTL